MPTRDITLKLATAITEQRESMRDGEPFPFVEIRDFVPDWCETKPNELTINYKLPPNFFAWVAGFQDFALAAEATNMWSYASSYMHLRHCIRIAAEAMYEKKTWHLAAAYDELARKSWSERVRRGATSFFKFCTCALFTFACAQVTQISELTKSPYAGTKKFSTGPGWSTG